MPPPVDPSASMNFLARSVTIGCCSWSLAFVFATDWFKELARQVFPSDYKGGAPLVGFVIPLLLAATFCCAFSTARFSAASRPRNHFIVPADMPRRIQVLAHSIQNCRGGEFSFDLLALVFLVFPAVFYCSTKMMQISESDSGQDKIFEEVANGLAMTAAMVLAVFLLVPVARHSPLLTGLMGSSWSHATAIRLHIWAGRLCLVFSAGHGLMYFYRWKFLWEASIWTLILPPHQCWTLHDTGYQPVCHNLEEKSCTCYALFRNGAGVLAATCWLVIAASSWFPVRRKAYAIFYKIHIWMAPLSILLILFHWKRGLVYLVGAILFYLASSMPVWVENWMCFRRHGGVQLHSIERLRDCNCTSLTFEASDVAIARFQPGQYVRLSSSHSIVAHPFTINTVPGQSQQLRIIFRATGPFTKQLARIETPQIGLEGFHGRSDRLAQALDHDTVIFLAGGIGITPYLSLLHQLHSALLLTPQTTKKVFLHWICRDAGLVQYIQQAYFEPLLWNETTATGFQIQIVMHQTGDVWEGSSSVQDGVNQRIVPTNISGIPFAPSQFVAASKNRLGSNWPLAAAFGTTCSVGLVISWMCYSHLQDEHEIASRIWAPLLILVLSLVVGLTVNLLPLRIEDGGVDADWMPVQSVEMNQSHPTALKRMDDAHDDDGDHGVMNATLSCPISIQERSGRPDMSSLLRPLHTAQSPAVFVCGPDSLTNGLRKELGHNAAWDPRRYLPHRVSVYSESFYM